MPASSEKIIYVVCWLSVNKSCSKLISPISVVIFPFWRILVSTNRRLKCLNCWPIDRSDGFSFRCFVGVDPLVIDVNSGQDSACC